MSSDSHNSTMTKARYGLDFFCCLTSLQLERCLFHTTVHTMHSSWTYQCLPLCPIHLCSPKKCRFCGRHMMAFIHSGNCLLFIVATSKFILNSCWFILLYNGLNLAGNKVSSFQTIIDITRAHRAVVFGYDMHGFTSNIKAVSLYCIIMISASKKLTNKHTKKLEIYN